MAPQMDALCLLAIVRFEERITSLKPRLPAVTTAIRLADPRHLRGRRLRQGLPHQARHGQPVHGALAAAARDVVVVARSAQSDGECLRLDASKLTN